MHYSNTNLSFPHKVHVYACFSHKSLFWSIYTQQWSQKLWSFHYTVLFFIWRCYISNWFLLKFILEMIYKQNLMIGWSAVFYDWNTNITYSSEWYIHLPKCGREIIINQTGIFKRNLKNKYVQISPTLNYFAESVFNLNLVL